MSGNASVPVPFRHSLIATFDIRTTNNDGIRANSHKFSQKRQTRMKCAVCFSSFYSY